ncbi:hypothetical protein Aduo_014088 [Ancylostoma duodenale]
MWKRLLLLWTIVPTLLGRGIVPPDARYGTVEPFPPDTRYGTAEQQYDQRYCNPECPCNSLNLIICCCPVPPSAVPYLISSTGSRSNELIISMMSSIAVICVILL